MGVRESFISHKGNTIRSIYSNRKKNIQHSLPLSDKNAAASDALGSLNVGTSNDSDNLTERIHKFSSFLEYRNNPDSPPLLPKRRSVDLNKAKSIANQQSQIPLNSNPEEQKANSTTQSRETPTDLPRSIKYKDISDLITAQDFEGDNFLFIAIIAKNTTTVFRLVSMLKDYKQLRLKNSLGQTALHLAALTDNFRVARRLMVAGADVKSQDRNGDTPLHIAVYRGCKVLVTTLLRPIAVQEIKLNRYQIPFQPIPQDMSIRNFNGFNCLLIAVLKGRIDIVDLLLDVDSDINTIDPKSGKTSLHFAAELNNLILIQHLLKKRGVVIDKKTYSGYTAAEQAFYRSHYDISYVLQCHGAARPRAIDLVETSDSDTE